MERTNSMKKTLSTIGISLLGLSGTMFAGPAGATTLADCGATPTGGHLAAGDNVCTLTFSTHGSYNFTAPAGVTNLAAIIVGAGGGADVNDSWGYAGSGGKVVYQDLTSGAGTTYTVTIGAGGSSGHSPAPTAGGNSMLAVDGGATLATANGGIAAGSGSFSFCTLDGSGSTYIGFGDSARGATTSTAGEACSAAPGVIPALGNADSNSVTAIPTLFSDYNEELGKGGVVLNSATYSSLGAADKGAGASILMNVATTHMVTHNAAGSPGFAIIRWTPTTNTAPSTALANTGFDSIGTSTLATGMLLLGSGLVAAGRLRKRSTGKHAA